MKSLMQPGSAVSSQYNSGLMGKAFGFTFGMDQNINTLTTGTRTTSDVAAAAPAEGDTTIDLVNAGNVNTFKKGETFTIAGIKALDPETLEPLNEDQRFVLTADAASTAAGDVTLSVFPAFCLATGVGSSIQTATISALPVAGDHPVFDGAASVATPMNMAFNKDAFTLVTADLVLPTNLEFAGRAQSDGISMRILKDFDIKENEENTRIDVLYGWTVLRPEYACRIAG